ncbi:MAG TPA: TraB/GumN family protein [Steroidobacteraceae bacterium]|nr:TraB/GumN family protein [Steroidobacteraceae bacterium]
MAQQSRCWLFALSLLGCLTASAASPVWVVHGTHNTIYLAGSVHMLKASDAQLPGAFDRAYAASKTLVMELALDKVDPLETASWMMEHGMLRDGVTLSSLLGPERYRRVTAESARLGVPAEVSDQLAPWALALQLTELRYAQLGFNPELGVEQQLEHRAQTDGKPIRGLETLDEQLGVLEHLSYPDQARFLDRVVDDLHSMDSETASVIAAWRNADAAKLATLLGDEYKSFPTLYRTLVTDRNRRWLPQIEQLLRDDQDYFVVVGALHLVGDGGLLELLRHDGFKAESLN